MAFLLRQGPARVNVQNRIPRTPADSAARLSVQERLLLFCLASGTDWRRAGVSAAAATQLLVRDLICRETSAARFRLSPLGWKVFAALVRTPNSGQDGDAA